MQTQKIYFAVLYLFVGFILSCQMSKKMENMISNHLLLIMNQMWSFSMATS